MSSVAVQRPTRSPYSFDAVEGSQPYGHADKQSNDQPNRNPPCVSGFGTLLGVVVFVQCFSPFAIFSILPAWYNLWLNASLTAGSHSLSIARFSRSHSCCNLRHTDRMVTAHVKIMASRTIRTVIPGLMPAQSPPGKGFPPASFSS